MSEKRIKTPRTSPLTEAQQAELQALSALPDDRIDLTDTPEQRDWKAARRGALFRPVKKQPTLRLDADLIDWFKRHATDGTGYQTRINQALRDYVTRTHAS